MNCFKKGELVTIKNGQYKGRDAEITENENSMLWVMLLTTTQVIYIPVSDLEKFDYQRLNT